MHFRFVLQRSGGLDAVRERFASRQVTARRGVDHLLHRHLGLSDRQFPESTRLYAETISLPIYPSLTSDELAQCTQAAAAVLSETA